MKSSGIKVELFAFSGSACQVSHCFSHGFIRITLQLMWNFAAIPEDLHLHSPGICIDVVGMPCGLVAKPQGIRGTCGVDLMRNLQGIRMGCFRGFVRNSSELLGIT